MLDRFTLISLKHLLVVALAFVLVVDQSLASNQQWANAVSLWGKRSVPLQLNEPLSKAAHYDNIAQPEGPYYNFIAKRATQWHAAQGLWGKRSDPQVQPQFYYAAAFQNPQA